MLKIYIYTHQLCDVRACAFQLVYLIICLFIGSILSLPPLLSHTHTVLSPPLHFSLRHTLWLLFLIFLNAQIIKKRWEKRSIVSIKMIFFSGLLLSERCLYLYLEPIYSFLYIWAYTNQMIYVSFMVRSVELFSASGCWCCWTSCFCFTQTEYLQDLNVDECY